VRREEPQEQSRHRRGPPRTLLSLINRLQRNTRLGRQPVAASNIADRHAGLHRLGDHGQLQIGRKASPARDAIDHLDLREVSDIGTCLARLIPRPPGYRRCPVKTGCSSSGHSPKLDPFRGPELLTNQPVMRGHPWCRQLGLQIFLLILWHAKRRATSVTACEVR